jgi:lipopolysaccharide biosynthesis regulator YciM
MGSSTSKPLTEEDVEQWAAGMRAKGEFRCAECGYGITVYRLLPECPMCHGSDWDRVPWRPYSRSFTSAAHT